MYAYFEFSKHLDYFLEIKNKWPWKILSDDGISSPEDKWILWVAHQVNIPTHLHQEVYRTCIWWIDVPE